MPSDLLETLLEERESKVRPGPGRRAQEQEPASFKTSLWVLQSLGLGSGGGTPLLGEVGVGGLARAEGECCGYGWSRGWQTERSGHPR